METRCPFLAERRSQGSATLVAVGHALSYCFQKTACTFAKATAHRKAAHPSFALVTTALCLCLFTAQLHAEEMTDGSAIVTSRGGSVRAIDADGRKVSADAHTVLRPSGLQWSAQRNSQIYLTFSNGAALALDSGTTVECLEFTQRPFGQDDIELGREPSVSKLRLRLESGRIALASNQLSPLSQLRIILPVGEVRLHKGSCLIEYSLTGVHLTAFEGNLTYYYPESDAREYLAAPRSVRISEQSALRQQIAEASTAESLEPQAALLARAAEHASQRVFFQPNAGTDQPAEPVLIVRPEYFDQPAIRPYQFKD